jgi:hypothetical protein
LWITARGKGFPSFGAQAEDSSVSLGFSPIDRGAQNLPGKWASSRFNLPLALHPALPKIDDAEPSIVLHNDAVLQGLSELPYMHDVEHRAVFTIGTGLGNARFTKREQEDG